MVCALTPTKSHLLLYLAASLAKRLVWGNVMNMSWEKPGLP